MDENLRRALVIGQLIQQQIETGATSGTVSWPQTSECRRCDGNGECGQCGGYGEVRYWREELAAFVTFDCYACDGTGECAGCGGAGFFGHA
jgi:DnaJ-class molecular chaperone